MVLKRLSCWRQTSSEADILLRGRFLTLVRTQHSGASSGTWGAQPRWSHQAEDHKGLQLKIHGCSLGCHGSTWKNKSFLIILNVAARRHGTFPCLDGSHMASGSEHDSCKVMAGSVRFNTNPLWCHDPSVLSRPFCDRPPFAWFWRPAPYRTKTKLQKIKTRARAPLSFHFVRPSPGISWPGTQRRKLLPFSSSSVSRRMAMSTINLRSVGAISDTIASNATFASSTMMCFHQLALIFHALRLKRGNMISANTARM